MPRPLSLAGIGLLLAAAPALAQTDAPRQTELGDPIRAESIVRLADQLRTLRDAERDPRFRDALEKLRRENPHISAEQLQMTKEFLRQRPDLLDPEKLREWAGRFGGANALNGMPEFDPKNWPKSLESFPRPGDGFFPKSQPPSPQGRTAPDAEEQFPPPKSDSLAQPKDEGRRGGFPGNDPPPVEWTPMKPFPAHSFETTLDPEQLARRQQQLAAVTQWWEQNVGPLRKTPAVQKLLSEMLVGDSKTTTGTQTLGDLVDAASRGDGPELRDWLKDMGVTDWKFPDLGGGKRRRGLHANWTPAAPSGGGSSWPRFGSAGDSWLPVILFGVIAAGALVLWWLWPKLTAAREDGPRPLPGLGPWPVDPRRIADRDGLVRAFEYLSVLLCGQGVRTWNHVTIAAALERAVPQADALAGPLAKLYALARYTPADEPLPPAAIAEARGYLCDLAGVSAA